MLEDWIHTQKIPVGIGIDCVCVSRMRALDERLRGALVERTFTPKERELAAEAVDYWQFLAGRFAVKEAVFKALSAKTPHPFDFRRVETLRREDGCPRISLDSIPGQVLEDTGVTGLLVSITGEEDYAIALVQAV